MGMGREGKDEKFEVEEGFFPLEKLFLFFKSRTLSSAHSQSTSSLFHPRLPCIKWSLSRRDSTRARDFPFNNFPKLFSIQFGAELRTR